MNPAIPILKAVGQEDSSMASAEVGLPFLIQYRPGDVRTGKDKSGKTWKRTMTQFYGDFGGSKGADGEKVDFYAGRFLNSASVPMGERAGQPVFIINQIDQDSGKFDEHKVMVGYPSKDEAVKAYLENYPKGWKAGPVKEMTVEELANWLKTDGPKRMAKFIPILKARKVPLPGDMRGGRPANPGPTDAPGAEPLPEPKPPTPQQANTNAAQGQQLGKPPEAQAPQPKGQGEGEGGGKEKPQGSPGIHLPGESPVAEVANQYKAWSSMPGNRGRSYADFTRDFSSTGGDARRMQNLAVVRDGAKRIFSPFENLKHGDIEGTLRSIATDMRRGVLENASAIPGVGGSIRRLSDKMDERLLMDYVGSLGFKVDDLIGESIDPYVLAEAGFDEGRARVMQSHRQREEATSLGVRVKNWERLHAVGIQQSEFYDMFPEAMRMKPDELSLFLKLIPQGTTPETLADFIEEYRVTEAELKRGG